MASDRNSDAPEDESRNEFSQEELGRAAPDESQAEGGKDSVAARKSTARHEVDTKTSKSGSTSGRTKSRRVFEDEYDDDEDYDEDEEEDEEEIRRRERRARAARRAARARKPKRKLNIPKTEEQLNIPKVQTIGLLGSVSLLMIIIWFSARLACNAHPDHLRDPRYVSVDQLARDPKNAALEFRLRFAAKDILLANELVTGKMADVLRDLIRGCEGNMEACEKDREALKNKVTATAKLLETSPRHAVAEVTTYVNNENPQTNVLDLVPDGQVWKVSDSRPGARVQPSDEPAASPAAPSSAEPAALQADPLQTPP